MIELVLKSNFRDWYDHVFDIKIEPYVIFERMNNGGMTRREMLVFLDSAGLCTPTHGLVKDVSKKIRSELLNMPEELLKRMVDLIVYTDETKHCGEGKIKLSLVEAEISYPDFYCSQFIPATQKCLGYSLRYLQVGDRKWWIEYVNPESWMSNAGGDGQEVNLLCEEERGYHSSIHYPMWAIDFVKANKLYAIDFNIAPGLEVLKKHLTGNEVVELIKKSIFNNIAEKEMKEEVANES